MRACKVRKLAVVVALGALVALVAKKLRGAPAPQFSNHPTVTGGPAARPDPLPNLVPAPSDPTVAARAETTLVAAPADPTVPPPSTEPEPTPEPEAAPDAEQRWVEPVDGECPEGYPIKAKVRSGIFHAPSSPTYERTKPDRCYPSVEAAEADGLRPPKR